MFEKIMDIDLRLYDVADAEAWDAFCLSSYQATFLHTRRFLSYHGDRFQDRSLILENEGKIVGLFPAAVNPGDKACIVSHPGITYGGILNQSSLLGEQMVSALSKICRYYAELGFQRLVYKAVPYIYHVTPAQDDVYALFRQGAKRFRCDLSSTIDVAYRRSVSERRKRSLRKAQRAGVEIQMDNRYLPHFWSVLEENLLQKHQATPVHSLAEIQMLADRFPDNIKCVAGLIDEKVEAGVLLFNSPSVFHAQYIASSSAGQNVSALDVVFEYCISRACSENKRWFNFGISTENVGLFLNEGLYRFKTEFGGGGTVHDFYEINLTRDE